MTDEQNSRDIREIRENMVKKDVHEIVHLAVDRENAENAKDIAALDAKFEKAEERRAADRRLILTALVLPIVIGIIMLYLQTQAGGK